MICALLGVLTLRFYVFYILLAAIMGSFFIGLRAITAQSFVRQVVVVMLIGLAIIYIGVLRNAAKQMEAYGSLQKIQLSRQNAMARAQSAFGKDIDVSTPTGALIAIPVGMAYLLFAPFPWEVTSLRQSFTLPEMVVWWASFPLLVLGLYFTIRYRLRQALPILLFTTMLTLAYSVFQANVGNAYRERSQLLTFYFIFVSVGLVIFKERREARKTEAVLDD